MTTKQEFETAIKNVISCKATMNCDCEYDELQADWLYYQCKSYCEAYKRRTEKGV